MAVPRFIVPAFEAGPPAALFEESRFSDLGFPFLKRYDVTPDQGDGSWCRR